MYDDLTIKEKLVLEHLWIKQIQIKEKQHN
jgi:hypothetical protein